MNLEEITLQDCLEMLQMKGQVTEISNGKIVGFFLETRTKSDESY